MNTPTITDSPEAVAAGSSPATLLGGITFDLYEYNPRRRMRGVEAARVKVTDNGDEYLLWMSPRDIRDNLKEHGESKGLRDALEAYRINAMPPNVKISDQTVANQKL